MTARRKRGFLTRWILPLTLGPLLTVVGLATAYRLLEPEFHLTRPPYATDFGVIVGRQVAVAKPRTRPPERTPDGRVIVEIGNVARSDPAFTLRTGAAVDDPLLAEGQDIGSTPPPSFDTVFRRVTVLDAVHFRVIRDDKPASVQLAGVVGPAFDAVCTDANGVHWKCGARARAELARVIGPRSVGCRDLVDTGVGTLSADCYAGVYSLSDWVVAQGWADPVDPYDQRFRSLADAARQNRLGRLQAATRAIQ